MKTERQSRVTKLRQYSYLFLVTLVFTCRATIGTAEETAAPLSNESEPAAIHGWVEVNRTVPKVTRPKTGLEFSTNPTIEKISHARVFEEPLVPIGDEPGVEENAALASALLGFARRTGPDDFSSLTGFLEKHPQSPWRAALLTVLGLEYYSTAHYSLALDAWREAWALSKDATDRKAKAIADRAGGELAYMYARLGRMAELEALLKSVEGRTFIGAATERITGAKEGLWNMKHRPGISFCCGPMALHCILRSIRPNASHEPELFDAASTTNGFSLPQVAELSHKIGMNYQLAFRKKNGDFIVPSVVHWKVGHYAALVRQEGNRYLLKDPTFGDDVWATRQALEAETSGYFLIPPDDLPAGWRVVDTKEGKSVWGKGITQTSDPKPTSPNDPKPQPCDGGGGAGGPVRPEAPGSSGGDDTGMAVSTVHLMLVSLNINDTPVGYAPPVGPAVRFTVRYNQREAFQPANFNYSNFGSKWTCDWISYITDNPSNTLADVDYYVRGGGTRTFTGFDTNSQTFAFQQYDQTLLKRTGPDSYEMTWANGAKFVFGQPDGSIGTSRKVFLTQVVDPFGNAVTLTYDANLRIAAITDAIGQVTTLAYGDTNDIYRITRVTDPFGRFAGFDYDSLGRLTNITDVIGLNSRFVYEGTGDFINALITPYGTNTFTKTEGGGLNGTTRSLETVYADGSRDRVEFNQFAIPAQPDPPSSLPTGMSVFNDERLGYRDTFYWSRTACATGYGDYTKAKVYHWLHREDSSATTAGILESTKEALEGRVWYNYPGQSSGFGATFAGSSRLPTKIGRVLDDGSTQLYTYAYDGFGHVTKSVDPVGRTFNYLYASNGIDLLEVRQTRAGNNELLFSASYNAQHLPLTQTDAAGQTTTFTYNSRGQLLTENNPKGETTAYTYDTDGYLIAVDGALPGTNDAVTAAYDDFGRTRTKTDLSGYMLTFDYDDLDRLVKVTHPDSTFEQITYDRLDPAVVQDRAGRQTLFEYDNVRQMKRRTDPLGRTTLFEWCRCGAIKSLTDPMGRVTSWLTDVQGRPIAKQYGDGSQVQYLYEGVGGRLRQVVDEKQQITQFTYNPDNTIKSIIYANATVLTPAVSYTYDTDYSRVTTITDGTGTTVFSYYPITTTPTLGANRLASVDGPLTNDTVSYAYDELGRRVSTAINDVASVKSFDAAGRVTSETNALGAFSYSYDGGSRRLVSQTFPNGLIEERAYGDALHDFELTRMTCKLGTTPVSEFLCGRDIAANRVTSWSQQAGSSAPDMFTFAYDAADQLLAAAVTNTGALVTSFSYAYDPAGNRLTEQVGASNYTATYNALNQLSTGTAPGASRTNEWDGKDRLAAVETGDDRTEFTYDGLGRMVGIRRLTNGVESSFRRFVWCDNRICEERDAAGEVTKRFFAQGMRVETGPDSGSYFYTRDHLGSIRELTDAGGNMRARYSYDPFGRRTRVEGDAEADYGFAGMFFATEAGLSFARFRVFDARLGRWLSRDPLRGAELQQGPNLYAYVGNNPVNKTDPSGLSPNADESCCKEFKYQLMDLRHACNHLYHQFQSDCKWALENVPEIAYQKCNELEEEYHGRCDDIQRAIVQLDEMYFACMEYGCQAATPCECYWIDLPIPSDEQSTTLSSQVEICPSNY